MDLYDHMYLWSQRSIKFNFIGIRSNFAGENIEKPPADFPPPVCDHPSRGEFARCWCFSAAEPTTIPKPSLAF